MGKTAVFVLATLHQIRPETNDKGKNIIDTLVLVHTREMAFQINAEFQRFGKFLENIRSEAIFGGVAKKIHQKMFEEDPPHIVCGTPGRVKDLVQSKIMKIDKLNRFILDECDQLLSQMGRIITFQRMQLRIWTASSIMLFRQICALTYRKFLRWLLTRNKL